jgi:outer membrane lipoprotein SlyB
MPVTSSVLCDIPPALQELITKWLLEHADEFENAAELESALQAYLWSYIDTKEERDAIGKKIDYGQLGRSLWQIARYLRVRQGFEYAGEVVIRGASHLTDTIGWSANLTHLAMPGIYNLLKPGGYINFVQLTGKSALKQGWDALPTSKLGVALAAVDVYFAWLDNKEDYAGEGAQKIACGTIVDSVIVIGAGAAGATAGSFIGGVTLGAALGAVSGGLLAPVGVAVGSAVGGMVGSWVADEIRKTEFDEWATDQLDAGLDQAGDALADASESVGDALADASAATGATLSNAAAQIESAFAPAVQNVVNLF